MRAPRPLPRRPPAPSLYSPSSSPPPSPASTRHRPPGAARRPTRWWARALAVAGAVLVAAGGVLVAAPRPAAAEVVHGLGWSGTVAGWSSWYGSYGMGDLGTAWCIDHGSAAPDAAFGYVPADLSEVDAGTQAAMAWALGTAGAGPDRVGAAALMLVLHDLMGATYPAGPLDVDALDPATLAGFDGAEADVVARARALKADALAHASLRGPLTMAAESAEVGPGEAGTLTVAVTDAGGRPVEGVLVRAAAAGATLTGPARQATGADGRATFPFTAGPGENRFAASGLAPDPALHAYASSSTPAQRVAVPRLVTLDATARFAPPPSTIRVEKTGDATAYLPVAGARFEVRPATGDGGGPGEPVGTLVTAADGTTGPLSVPPGRYVVTEVAPPPGYEVAGPWPVEVEAGDDAVVEVHDRAERGWARITKVDAVSGEPVAGATLSLSYDGDADGTYETDLDPVVTGEEPSEVRLRPGDYRLTEVQAPDGYEGLEHPVDFSVRPGDRVEVVVENRPAATLAFRKVPSGPVDEDQVVLAGAVFVVRPEGGGEVAGRCTTDERGRCSLPPGSLDAGATYCWEEVEAPPGFGTAEPGCVEAGAPGTVTTVEVEEPSRHTVVEGEKVDVVTGAPVAGAVYDLYRRDGEGAGRLPAPWLPETGAALVDGAVRVARATSDDGGAVRWGPQVPGFVYCAKEHEAPPGYQLDPSLRCTDGPLVAGEPALLRLPDRPVAPPTTVPPTTAPPTTVPPTTVPPTTVPPTTVPPTTVPSTTPPTRPRPPTQPPAPVPTLPPTRVPSPAPPSPTALPETGTGTRTAGLASVGSGLLFLGAAAVAARPPGVPPDAAGGTRPNGGAGAPGRPPTRPARPAPPPGSAPRRPAPPAAPGGGRWPRRS